MIKHSGEKLNNCISEFIGMFYKHVNLQSGIQKELILALLQLFAVMNVSIFNIMCVFNLVVQRILALICC